MVEAGAKQLPEQDVVEAICYEAVQELFNEIWIAELGINLFASHHQTR